MTAPNIVDRAAGILRRYTVARITLYLVIYIAIAVTALAVMRCLGHA